MPWHLRIARLESSLYDPIGESPVGFDAHARLVSVIRQHSSPVVASLLAEPRATPDGRFVEWYSDLAGEPILLQSLPEAERARAHELLDERLRAVDELANRLGEHPDGTEAADELRAALRYPSLDDVYVVDGQPVIAFWGHSRVGAAPLGPVVPPPSILAAPVVAAAPRWRRWILALLLLLLLAALAFWFHCCHGEPPVADLPPAAPVEEPLIAAPDPNAELLEELERVRAEGERLEAKFETLLSKAQRELDACPVPPPPPPPPVAVKKRPPEAAPCVAGDGSAQPIDIYLLQDLTASFRDDLPNMNRFVRDLTRRIAKGDLGAEVRVGVGSFTDKPVPAVRLGPPDGYAFRNHLSLTRDMGRVANAVSRLTIRSGEDYPEAQYEALVELGGNAKKVGFGAKARNLVALATDAEPHKAGDWPHGAFGIRIPGLTSPGPEDGRADGDPLNEDYPSARQVRASLDAANLTPIFLVAGPSINTYRAFVRDLGRGVALPISANSSNLLQALLSGVKKACEAPDPRAER